MYISERGLYRARNGEIFFLNNSIIDDEGLLQWVLSEDIEMSPLTWFDTGKVYIGEKHELDLVERII
jgi:hypothetical protein